MVLFVVYESVAGYALFQALPSQQALSALCAQAVTDETFEHVSSTVLRLVDFVPFLSIEQAVGDLGKLQNHEAPDYLISFVETRLPRSRRGNVVQVGVSDQNMASDLSNQLERIVVVTDVVLQLLRIANLHFLRYLGGYIASAGQLARLQRDVAIVSSGGVVDWDPVDDTAVRAAHWYADASRRQFTGGTRAAALIARRRLRSRSGRPLSGTTDVSTPGSSDAADLRSELMSVSSAAWQGSEAATEEQAESEGVVFEEELLPVQQEVMAEQVVGDDADWSGISNLALASDLSQQQYIPPRQPSGPTPGSRGFTQQQQPQQQPMQQQAWGPDIGDNGEDGDGLASLGMSAVQQQQQQQQQRSRSHRKRSRKRVTLANGRVVRASHIRGRRLAHADDDDVGAAAGDDGGDGDGDAGDGDEGGQDEAGSRNDHIADTVARDAAAQHKRADDAVATAGAGGAVTSQLQRTSAPSHRAFTDELGNTHIEFEQEHNDHGAADDDIHGLGNAPVLPDVRMRVKVRRRPRRTSRLALDEHLEDLTAPRAELEVVAQGVTVYEAVEAGNVLAVGAFLQLRAQDGVLHAEKEAERLERQDVEAEAQQTAAEIADEAVECAGSADVGTVRDTELRPPTASALPRFSAVGSTTARESLQVAPSLQRQQQESVVVEDEVPQQQQLQQQAATVEQVQLLLQQRAGREIRVALVDEDGDEAEGWIELDDGAEDDDNDDDDDNDIDDDRDSSLEMEEDPVRDGERRPRKRSTKHVIAAGKQFDVATARSSRNGNTLLHIAAAVPHCPAMIQLLLRYRADPLARNHASVNAVDVAFAHGHWEYLALMLQPYRADGSITRLWWYLMFQIGDMRLSTLATTLGGNPLDDALATLQQAGLSIDMLHPNSRWSLLHRAVSQQQVGLVSALLRAGADANVRAEASAATPMHVLAAHADTAADAVAVQTLQLLLSYGGDPCCQDRNGWTPLHTALRHARLAVVTELLGEHESNRQLSAAQAYVAVRADASAASLASASSEDAAASPLDLQLSAPAAVASQRDTTAAWLANAGATERAHSLAHTRYPLVFGRHVLRSSQHLGIRNKQGQTPLHLAVQHSLLGVVTALVARRSTSVDLDAQDNAGFTAVHVAIAENNAQLLRLLLRARADSSLRAHGGIAPVHAAVQAYRRVGVIPSDDKAPTPPDPTCVVHTVAGVRYWAQPRDQPMIKSLLAALFEGHADINALTDAGWSALMIAVENGHDDVAAMLANNGASGSVLYPDGTPLFHRAIRRMRVSLCRALLSQAPDSYANALHPRTQQTPLHVAVGLVEPMRELAGKRLAYTHADGSAVAGAKVAVPHPKKLNDMCELFVELLLNNGADATRADLNGFTVLHVVAKLIDRFLHPRELVRKLLHNYASPLAMTHRGVSPFGMAVRSHTWWLAQMFIDVCDVSVADVVEPQTLATPLHRAAAAWDVDAVRWLIKHRAPVNACMRGGITPLHCAVVHRRTVAASSPAAEEDTLPAPSSNSGSPASSVARGAESSGAGSQEQAGLQTVQLLLTARANVDAADATGWTALHKALIHASFTVVEALLNAAASVTLAEKREGNTPLHVACARPKRGNLSRLVRRRPDADWRARNNLGWSAIELCLAASPSIARNLLPGVTDDDVIDEDTPAEERPWSCLLVPADRKQRRDYRRQHGQNADRQHQQQQQQQQQPQPAVPSVSAAAVSARTAGGGVHAWQSYAAQAGAECILAPPAPSSSSRC